MAEDYAEDDVGSVTLEESAQEDIENITAIDPTDE